MDSNNMRIQELIDTLIFNGTIKLHREDDFFVQLQYFINDIEEQYDKSVINGTINHDQGRVRQRD